VQPKTIANKSELAGWIGVNRGTLYTWLKLPGFPTRPDGSHSPYEIGRWSVMRELTGDDDDTEIVDSDELLTWKIKHEREKYRERKLKNDSTEASLIPVGQVAERHAELAHLLRTAVEQLQREYGNDAAELITESLDEFERRLVGDSNGDTNSVTQPGVAAVDPHGKASTDADDA
jgi:hypothetical protein